MENENNTTMQYDVEFDITRLFRDLLSSRDISGNAAASDSTWAAAEPDVAPPTNQYDMSGNNPWISMMQRNQVILDDLIYSYNIQMERYNQNVERFTQLLLSSQTRIHQHMMTQRYLQVPVASPPAVPRYSTPLQRRNAIRNDGNLIRFLLNPQYGTTTSTTNLLYTYLFPNSQNNRSTSQTLLLTAEQRANAIQTITYSSSSQSRDNVCPISLLPFTEGEQVCQIKQCLHIFKPEYLNNWLNNYSTCCPICRYDMRNYSRELGESDTNDTNNPVNEAFDYESDESSYD